MWSRRLLGLDPMPVPGHVFSVDAERLRYAAFNRVAEELVLDEFHQEDLEAGDFSGGPLGGPVQDIDRFANAVEDLLERLTRRPEAASLVVPDRWLRVAFTDLERLPRGTDMDEVLRFKLRRLVPFRVDDLRVSSAAAPALEAGQNRVRRVMLGFGIETLFGQLEESFEGKGVSIGHLSSESLALLPALAPLLTGCLGIVAHVTGSSYSLVVTLDGEPVLHRFKPLAADESTRSRLVPRDLGLTASYVRRELKGRRIGEAVLVAAGEDSRLWKLWLEEAFEHPVRSAGEELPHLPGAVSGISTWDALPLMGAASRGIS